MKSRALFLAGLVAIFGSLGCHDPKITAPASLAVTAVSPNFATSLQQSTVSVTGMGFQSGLSVFFGGQAATVLSLTNTSLSVLTPANVEGVVNIVVANPNGEKAQLTGGFTFYALGAFSVTPSEALPLDWVTVGGTGFQQGARTTVGGVEATVRSLSAFAVNIIVPFCPPGAADVVVTNPNGRVVTLAGRFTCQTIVLTPSTLSVSPGGQFSLSWVSPRDLDQDDWVPDEIRLCRVGNSCGSASAVWGTTVKGTSDTFVLNAPTTSGDYEFRYLIDGVQELSKSATVVVK